VVYRFGTSLYYANSARLLADLQALATQGDPLEWLVFDCAAIVDIDYTASAILTRVVELAQQHHVRFVLSSVLPPVRRELNAYGIAKKLDQYCWYETPGEALDAFRATRAK
jgi:sulfate permease, SulP family